MGEGTYSASATATSGADIGPVTVGAVTFGPQYASGSGALDSLISSATSSPLILILVVAAAVFGYLLFRRAKLHL